MNSKMVQQNLIDYVKKQLVQGYTPSTIRTTLATAGYSTSEIENALLAAGSRRPSVLQFLLLFFFGIFIAAIILFLFITVTKPVLQPTLSASLLSSEIQFGDDVLIIANVQGANSATLEVTLRGPEGKLTSQTATITTDPASLSIPISTPQNTLPGEYTAIVTLQTPTQTLSQTLPFVVKKTVTRRAPLQKPEETTAIVAQKTCATSCDDFNFCTVDTCVQGQCINTQVTPCCGNHQCEPHENCPLDCQLQPQSPDTISLIAKQLAPTDLAGAMSKCLSLGQQAYIDTCLTDVSDSAQNKQPCEHVSSDDLRDACYMPFAYTKDFSVCEKITNPSMKNSCNSLKNIATING